METKLLYLHERVRRIRRAQVREFLLGRGAEPEDPRDGGYDCMLAIAHARGVDLSAESLSAVRQLLIETE